MNVSLKQIAKFVTITSSNRNMKKYHLKTNLKNTRPGTRLSHQNKVKTKRSARPQKSVPRPKAVSRPLSLTSAQCLDAEVLKVLMSV